MNRRSANTWQGGGGGHPSDTKAGRETIPAEGRCATTEVETEREEEEELVPCVEGVEVIVW